MLDERAREKERTERDTIEVSSSTEILVRRWSLVRGEGIRLSFYVGVAIGVGKQDHNAIPCRELSLNKNSISTDDLQLIVKFDHDEA